MKYIVYAVTQYTVQCDMIAVDAQKICGSKKNSIFTHFQKYTNYLSEELFDLVSDVLGISKTVY